MPPFGIELVNGTVPGTELNVTEGFRMSNSQASYHGGIAMVSVDDAEEIADLCMLAGRPERIGEFIGGRLTPSEVKARLTETAAAPAPAAPTANAASAATPVFPGGPTPGQRDLLAAALETRFRQMYPKTGG
jgi:hypothetical protein